MTAGGMSRAKAQRQEGHFQGTESNYLSAGRPQQEAEWKVTLGRRMGLCVVPEKLVASGKDRSNDHNRLLRLGLQGRDAYHGQPGNLK